VLRERWQNRPGWSGKPLDTLWLCSDGCSEGRPPTAKDGLYGGIVLEYQYQEDGIGIVLVVVKNHLYPIPEQYKSFTGNAAIRNKKVAHKYITNNI
jgi:hypothetical protein